MENFIDFMQGNFIIFSLHLLHTMALINLNTKIIVIFKVFDFNFSTNFKAFNNFNLFDYIMVANIYYFIYSQEHINFKFKV